MTESISEILKKVAGTKKKVDKIALLREYESLPIKNVLIAMYDKEKMIPLLPKGTPPYTPNNDKNAYGALFKESKKMKYFFKGWGGDDLKQMKREQIFIEMLETIHADDALLMVDVINQTPMKGITKKTINDAYGLNIK